MDNNVTVSDREAQSFDVISLLKQRLPDYIVQCFLARGYDEPNVIATMDITDSPGNSIRGIETYIGSKFPDNEEYYHNRFISLPFEFPPGHRKRICNFINEIKQLLQIEHHSTSKRKIVHQDKPIAKRPKPVKVVEEISTINIPSISKQIRSNLNKWLRKQSSCEIINLQENKDYSVSINSNTKDPTSFTACIRCLLCGTAIRLQQQDNTSPYLISNWCRHIKNCITTTRKAAHFQQPAIDHFCAKKKTAVPNIQGTYISI